MVSKNRIRMWPCQLKYAQLATRFNITIWRINSKHYWRDITYFLARNPRNNHAFNHTIRPRKITHISCKTTKLWVNGFKEVYKKVTMSTKICTTTYRVKHKNMIPANLRKKKLFKTNTLCLSKHFLYFKTKVEGCQLLSIKKLVITMHWTT